MTIDTRGIALTAALAVLSLSPALAKDKPIGEIVAAGHRTWVQGLTQGDAKMAASIYAPKSAILPPNNHRIEGRDAIEQEFAKMGKATFELAAVEVRQSGGTAWCSGTYKQSGADGKVLDVGKFLEIWVQTDQGWKLWRDMWNSDNPK